MSANVIEHFLVLMFPNEAGSTFAFTPMISASQLLSILGRTYLG